MDGSTDISCDCLEELCRCALRRTDAMGGGCSEWRKSRFTGISAKETTPISAFTGRRRARTRNGINYIIGVGDAAYEDGTLTNCKPTCVSLNVFCTHEATCFTFIEEASGFMTDANSIQLRCHRTTQAMIADARQIGQMIRKLV